MTETATRRRDVSTIPADRSKPRWVVVRNVSGTDVQPSEVIEIADTRRATMLERDRRLRPLEYEESIYSCSCGRMWIDKKSANAHCS